MYLSLWFQRLSLTCWCLSHWFWSSLFLHSSRHHICWLWNLLPDIESLLMNLQTLACDMTFLLAVNLDWFIDVWLCRLGKIIHVLAYQITFTLFTTWVNIYCICWCFRATFRNNWNWTLILKHKTGVTLLTTMSRIPGLLIAIQLDSRLTEGFLMSLTFHHSWHTL